MESICKTQCRNLTLGNRYGGLPKRFTRQSPRMISIRGLYRRNGKEANWLIASLTSFGK